MRYLSWIMARFRRPRAVILVALVLALPALASGFFVDEYVQAARWKAGFGAFLRDCFVFGSGDPATNQRELIEGLGAWWTAPDFKIAFWRPLSALTHALDLSLWPRSAMLMHLHTLLWFVGLLLALSLLYRRLLTPRVAVLALALYAWDDARGQVLSWIAKRNLLIAGVFGALVILSYDRWRREGWRLGAWLAPLCFALGMLSAEMALATSAYLFAYALCLDRGTLVERMVRLTPYLLVVVLWQAVYLAGGYGVEATIGYVHPLGEPLTYARRWVEAVPVFALGQLTPVGSDFWGVYPPPAKVVVFLAALGLLVLLARIAWPRVAKSPEARFWLIGAGLSLLPISASAPQDQNLVFVGFGAAPVLAMVLASFVDDPPAARWPRFAIGALALFNLALAPLLLPPKCLTMLAMGYGLGRTDQSIPRDPAITHQTLVVVWTVSEGGVYASSNHRYAEGIPQPGKTRILATSFGDVSVTRLDALTLRLAPKNGFFDGEMHRLMRGPSRPFRQGEVVQLSNLTATITELTDQGRPKTVEFRFSAPLESPEWLWMRGEGFGLVGWTPPRVGETVVVKAAMAPG